MQIDVHHISTDAAVQSLARLIRRQFGVWVGLVQNDDIVPLAPDVQVDVRKVCGLFSCNPTSRGSCVNSIREWGGASLESTKCHAGLAASSFQIPGTDASVYISGFVADEWRENLSEVAETITTEGWANEDQAALLVESISTIDRSGREALKLIADELVAVTSKAAIEMPEGYGLDGIVGKSEPMTTLFDQIRRLSTSHSTLLIRGENGTGKDLVARAIHARSPRVNGPFVAQNCAAIPRELVESELFGHTRGAFSGAVKDRQGLFEYADGGTFFLDEIGDMSLDIQSKLLRVLQEGSFIRVGDETTRKVDVRVICATHRDLGEMVKEGTFREDLYFRINVLRINVPALKERGTDIELLTRFFVSQASRRHGIPRKDVNVEAQEMLSSHDWPGNVRQLENQLERAVILAQDEPEITPEHLDIRPSESDGVSFGDGLLRLPMPEAVYALEKEMILSALTRNAWNKTRAAKQLGISRRNLIRRVASMNLESIEGEDD